jgi:hypothetical protein
MTPIREAYHPDEWHTLINGVHAAIYGILAADPQNTFAATFEQISEVWQIMATLDHAALESRESSFMAALIHDSHEQMWNFADSWDDFHHFYQRPQACLQAITQAAQVANQRIGWEDARRYKRFLYYLADKIAYTFKESGATMHPPQVSSHEAEMLRAIWQALDVRTETFDEEP